MPKSLGIDLVKLYGQHTPERWNKYLTTCHKSQNTKELLDMMNRLQVGMDKMVKDKLDTEDLRLFFIRLTRSCENTLKRIWREKHKNPNYDPLNQDAKYLDEKRKLDLQFEKALRKASF